MQAHDVIGQAAEGASASWRPRLIHLARVSSRSGHAAYIQKAAMLPRMFRENVGARRNPINSLPDRGRAERVALRCGAERGMACQQAAARVGLERLGDRQFSGKNLEQLIAVAAVVDRDVVGWR